MADDQGPISEIPQAYYEGIKQKFAEARDLRLKYRPQGTTQYTSDLTGALAELRDRPARRRRSRRASRSPTRSRCLFIGGGFSALLTAARLRERGVESIRIVERGADVGGTWYWNRYPGAACDVPAYDYLPLLDEMDYVPSRLYAKGPEIFAHCQAIARRYDLYELAVFRTTVLSTTWDDAAKLWVHRAPTAAMRCGPSSSICANGTLSKPKLSKIEGMERFTGHSFHSSRWDYAYTGEDLENLSDKVVGIIGTGASAVQAIPRLGEGGRRRSTSSSARRRASTSATTAPTDPAWRRGSSPAGSRPGG